MGHGTDQDGEWLRVQPVDDPSKADDPSKDDAPKIMGGKRGSSGEAGKDAAKRFKHGEPKCVGGSSDLEYEHKIEQH